MMFGKGIRKVGRLFNRDHDSIDSVDVSEKDGVRALHLGSVTVQSAMRLSAPFELELSYSRGVMCFLLFRDDVREILIIGLGGGSIPKYIHRFLPRTRVRTVELNPAVVAAARQYFFLPEDDDRLAVVLGDGAEYVRNHPAASDVLVLDAFDGKGLASELTSQEFYDCCHDALASDGILVVNLWGSDRNFDVYLQRIEQSFEGRVLIMPTGRPGNILVFAFKGQGGGWRWKSLRERARILQKQHRIDFLDFVERLRDNNLNTAISLR